MQSKGAILATGQHNQDWYFDNTASYHMTYDLNNFKDPATLTKCRHPEDEITLADGSVVFPDGIGTVSLVVCIKLSKERMILSGVWYCSKLDTKLISLGTLERKRLSYSSHKGILEVRDNAVSIMIGHLKPHNLYKISLAGSANDLQTILS